MNGRDVLKYTLYTPWHLEESTASRRVTSTRLAAVSNSNCTAGWIWLTACNSQRSQVDQLQFTSIHTIPSLFLLL